MTARTDAAWRIVAVVLLLSLEIGALILLLGAEVIAQLQRSYEHGLCWYEAPPDIPPKE